jgi:hypothetical protein
MDMLATFDRQRLGTILTKSDPVPWRPSTNILDAEKVASEHRVYADAVAMMVPASFCDICNDVITK